MPDIDPAALSRTDSIPNASITPSLTIKTLPLTQPTSQKAPKLASSPAVRVDIEPLYTALKSAIGDHWIAYKDAVSRFILGHLSQKELARQTGYFIAIDDTRLHLHNQLICAIHCNVLRDAPESGVATWVSANDKPTSVAKPVSGDVIEQRLKSEVLSLPPRIRHRLKGIQDEPSRPLTREIQLQSLAKRPHQPSSSSALPTNVSAVSASSSTIPASGGLSKDLDIRRRYTAPLPSEILDLPTTSSLSDRLLPMCYEESLPSGPSNAGVCGELLATAAETFIKEALGGVLGKSREDAPLSGPLLADAASSIQPPTMLGGVVGPGLAAPGAGCVMTASYRQRLEREAAAYTRGEVKRSEAGLLPVEMEAAKCQGKPGDLKLAWELGDVWLGAMLPWLGPKVVLEAHGDYDIDMASLSVGGEGGEWRNANDSSRRRESHVNGGNLTTNGPPAVNGIVHDDQMDIDEMDWGWQGGGQDDRDALNSLLDNCLAIDKEIISSSDARQVSRLR